MREICREERQLLPARSLQPQQTEKGWVDPVMTSNWIRRTGWATLFEGASRECLLRLAKTPGPGPLILSRIDDEEVESPEYVERKLQIILAALDRLFDRYASTLQNTDISILRWLQGRSFDTPHKAPFELISSAESDRRYRRL